MGAGGNAGAVAVGFLFRIESLATNQALMFIGLTVLAAAALVFVVRFSARREFEERRAVETTIASRSAGVVMEASGSGLSPGFRLVTTLLNAAASPGPTSLGCPTDAPLKASQRYPP